MNLDAAVYTGVPRGTLALSLRAATLLRTTRWTDAVQQFLPDGQRMPRGRNRGAGGRRVTRSGGGWRRCSQP